MAANRTVTFRSVRFSMRLPAIERGCVYVIRLTMEFDTKKFIMEIQTRPAIWNTKLPEYSDKILRQRAWEELVHIYYGTELTKEEKHKLGNDQNHFI